MKGTGMKNFSGYTAAVAMLAAATLAGCPKPADLHTQVLSNPNTIDGKQLYFIPSDTEKRAGDEFYSRVVTADNTEFPVDPTDHTVIDFGAGDPAVVELSEPVFYFGEAYSTIYVGSNGTIGLGAAGAGNDSLANHFASPEISLLPVDATVAGSVVTVAEFSDNVVVTFDNITVNAVTGNQFQAEFIKTRGIDGDIALTYPEVTTTAEGIVGLSNGQLADASQAEIDAFVGRFRSSNLNANSANTSTAKLGS